jgi:hypothetical protein
VSRPIITLELKAVWTRGGWSILDSNGDSVYRVSRKLIRAVSQASLEQMQKLGNAAPSWAQATNRMHTTLKSIERTMSKDVPKADGWKRWSETKMTCLNLRQFNVGKGKQRSIQRVTRGDWVTASHRMYIQAKARASCANKTLQPWRQWASTVERALRRRRDLYAG